MCRGNSSHGLNGEITVDAVERPVWPEGTARRIKSVRQQEVYILGAFELGDRKQKIKSHAGHSFSSSHGNGIEDEDLELDIHGACPPPGLESTGTGWARARISL